MDTKKIKEFWSGVLDVVFYWIPVLLESIVKMMSWAFVVTLSGYGINYVIYLYSVTFLGGERITILETIPYIPAGIFVFLVLVILRLIWTSALDNRRLISSLEPFRYIRVSKYSNDGVGIKVMNLNQSHISRVHGIIKQVISDDLPPVFFSETGVPFISGARHSNRSLIEYTDQNQVFPFHALCLEIAYQKPNGECFWRVDNDNIKNQLPPIRDNSKYTIVVKVNIHSTATNQLTYQLYEVSMGFSRGKLKISNMVRLP